MLGFIAEERILVDPLVTHRLPAALAADAYNGLADDKANHLGILLDLQSW